MKLNILALVAIFGIASPAFANGGDGSNTPKNRRFVICAMGGGSETGPKAAADALHVADPEAEVVIVYSDSNELEGGAGSGGGSGSNFDGGSTSGGCGSN